MTPIRWRRASAARGRRLRRSSRRLLQSTQLTTIHLAIATWEMDDAGWNRIYQPMLSVLGEHSLPFFAEGREVLRSNCFDVENFDLFNTSHLLQIENPEGTAAGLRSFFSRHPMR